MIKKVSLTILSASILYTVANAQQEHTLQFMPSIAQSTYINPAIKPKYKVTVGLPGLSSNYVAFSNSGFKYNNVFETRSDDSVVVKVDDLINRLAKKNYLQTNANTDLLFVSVKVHPLVQANFNVTVKSFARFMYPKDLLEFAVEGNGNKIGETISISPQFEASTYLEYALGGSYQLNEKIRVGGKLKLLKGFANITTKRADVELTTEDDFDIFAKSDISVFTSNVNRWDDEDFEGSEIFSYLKNGGFGVDIGATYQLTDELNVGFSIVDLGTIKWKQDVTEYYTNPDTAQYAFTGVDAEELIETDNTAFDNVIDSVENNFEILDREVDSYNSPTPVKTYLSATYKLPKGLNAGAVLFFEKFRSRLNTGFSLNVSKEFAHRLALSLSYSAMHRSFSNFGAGISFNLTPVQLYFVSDTLLGTGLSLLANGELNNHLKNTQTTSLRFGINFVFGWDKSQTKLLDK